MKVENANGGERSLRIAFVTHSFHCRSSAALRSWNLARGMAMEGVQVAVFCLDGPEPSDGPVPPGIQVWSPARVSGARFLDGVERRLPFLMSAPGWGWLGRLLFRWTVLGRRHNRRTRQIIGAFRNAHQQAPFDFILAVWPTFEPFWAAEAVARREHIPWAVEFQDPWASFYVEELRSTALAVLRSGVHSARFLVNVCPSWCRQDERDLEKRSVCVPTGFWPMEKKRERTGGTGALRITYTGTLWCFDLRPLAEGMALARQRGFSARLHYYGGDQESLRKVFEELGCGDALVTHGRVTPEEAYAAQADSEVLLLFTMSSKPSTFGYKFAEVVSHGLPVLLVGPTDDEVQGLASGLTRVVPCQNAVEVAEAIERLCGERPIVPKPCPAARQYTWDELARRLLKEVNAGLKGAGDARLLSPIIRTEL